MASFGGQTPVNYVTLSQRFTSAAPTNGTVYTVPSGKYAEVEIVAIYHSGSGSYDLAITRSGLVSVNAASVSAAFEFTNIKFRLSAGDSLTYSKFSTSTDDLHANVLEFNNP